MTVNYFQKANKFKQAGQLEDATTYYQQAIESNPKFYWSYHNLGESLSKLGKWEEAAGFYQKAVSINPHSAWSYYGLGQALAQTSKWDEAISAYLRAIQISPDFYCFYSNLGGIFEQIATNLRPEFLGNYHWQGILPESNQDPDVELYDLEDENFLETTSYLANEGFLERMYQIYLKRNSDEEGKNYYTYLLNQGMKRQEVLMGIRQSEEFKDKLTNSLRSINLYYLSDEMFLQSTNHIKDESFVTEVYWTYLKRDADHVGKNHYTQHLAKEMSRSEVISAFRQSTEFINQLTNSIAAICWQESVNAYRRAIELNPSSCNSKQNLSKALTALGKIQAQTGQVDLAIENYQEVIAKSQGFAEVYYNQANAFLQQGQRDEAIESFKKAIYAKPNWIDPYLSLGETLKLEKPHQAIIWWQKAIPYIQSEDARIDLEFKITHLLVEQGQLDKALTRLEQAIGLTDFIQLG
jgi:Putative Zn-dependent protease, contains TPR repeats